MFGYSHHILPTRRINTFWSRVIEKFRSGGIIFKKHFGLKKSENKNQQNSQIFLKYFSLHT